MPFRQLWTLVLLASAPALGLASPFTTALHAPVMPPSLAARDHQVWTWAVRASKFAAVPHSTARTSCQPTNLPEALATPNPLLDATNQTDKVTVSFIIGTDGLVYSPLILESAGLSGDRTVLNAVRSWRYRPATCNGVPTEAEARIQFSDH
jgi:TonB family protein